jgi:hypothetical protein
MWLATADATGPWGALEDFGEVEGSLYIQMNGILGLVALYDEITGGSTSVISKR